MYVLKYKNEEGWKTLYGDVFNSFITGIDSCLKKEDNLSDLLSINEALENLGLTGKDNDTHYHDAHYLPMIEEVNNKLESLDSVSLKKKSNLADVENKPSALINLGLTGNVTSHSHDAYQKQIDDLAEQLEKLKTSVYDYVLPVGTILAYTGAVAPVTTGTWLLCNGSTIPAKYTALRALVGTKTPDLNGRFLEGSASPNTIKEAGLPNITGGFPVKHRNFDESGAFYSVYDGGNNQLHNWGYSNDSDWGSDNEIWIDASKSSAVYGKAETVQPASYTVCFYIKAE